MRINDPEKTKIGQKKFMENVFVKKIDPIENNITKNNIGVK
jgi:hypothetical protein